MALNPKLLEPISAEKPCGEDLSYDPEFTTLERDIQGKPEEQVGDVIKPAEEPKWEDVRERSLAFLSRSKDLRLGVFLTLSLLKLEGISGFRDGLALLRGFLERYWDTVYPLLDPEDNNDPTQRVNVLRAMTNPLRTFGDRLRFLERLQEVPLTDSIKMGRFSLADIVRSQSGAPVTPEKPAPTAAQIDSAFRETKPELLRATNDAVSEAIGHVKAIDEKLTTTIGADRAFDWTPLISALSEIQKKVQSYLGDRPKEGAVAGEAGASGAASFSGAVKSRTDVVWALDQICQFYRQHEPSSPIPFLLQRVKKLVEMDYLQIINELTPEALEKVRTLTGLTAEAPPPAGQQT